MIFDQDDIIPSEMFIPTSEQFEARLTELRQTVEWRLHEEKLVEMRGNFPPAVFAVPKRVEPVDPLDVLLHPSGIRRRDALMGEDK